MIRFIICLVHIMERETGWDQPADGRAWVRGGDGATWDERRGVLVLPNGATRPLPTKPDGMAFDDDPNDTGGRTCCGVLQRVYDGYRDARGLPRQDVWHISDSEINDIYLRQYWQPLQADRLPAGLDLQVFDMGVNAGIGRGAKILQRLVGTVQDGQIGEATIAATYRAAEARGLSALIQEYGRMREANYRQFHTFYHHGDGWLKRNAITTRAAMAMVEPGQQWETRVTEAPTPPTPTGPRVTEPPPDANAATAGNVAVGIGGTGAANTAVEITKAARDVAAKPDAGMLDFLLAIASTPSFWLSVFAIAGALFLWIERKRLAGAF